MAIHVKKDDVVEVIAGDHKGEQGKVLRVFPRQHLVVIEGVNMVYRHVRPSRRNPQGGRLEKEAPLPLSNVLPIDPKRNRGSRVRFVTEAGTGQHRVKRRVTVSGTVLDEVTKSE